jgi:hypothetical protein
LAVSVAVRIGGTIEHLERCLAAIEAAWDGVGSTRIVAERMAEECAAMGLEGTAEGLGELIAGLEELAGAGAGAGAGKSHRRVSRREWGQRPGRSDRAFSPGHEESRRYCQAQPG